MRAAFVAPVFYTGTSFERICTSMKECITVNQLDIDYIVLTEVANELNPSDFDDVHFFKYQLKLLELLTQNTSSYDRILFVDFFNPGMDLLRYYLDRMKIDTKFYALLHGGTFLEDDLLKDAWIPAYEKAWTTLYEKVYVPSAYAQSILPSSLADTSVASNWGLDAIQHNITPSDTKDIEVLFPHRISDDKGIRELLIICELCPEVNFVITSPSGIIPDEYQHITNVKNLDVITCKDNESYYALIGRSKIVLSCALQELYGYSVAESVLSGAYPVLPNRQVYPEYYDQDVLYNSPEEAAYLIQNLLANEIPTYNPDSLSAHSFKAILDDFIRES